MTGPTQVQVTGVQITGDGLARTLQIRRAMALLMGMFIFSIAFQLLTATEVDATEAEELTGFVLEKAGADGQQVRLVVRTATGRPLDAGRVQFKTRDRVVRITFEGLPMASDLGQEVPFEPLLPRIEKGYAIPDGEGGSMVRLRFDVMAEEALVGWTLEPTRGGSAILVPFGTDVPTPLALDPERAADTARKTAPGVLSGFLGEPKPFEKPLTAGIPDAPVAKAAAPEARKKTAATPISLAQNDRGPSFSNVGVSLMAVMLLVIALGLGWRKMQGARMSRWSAPAVNVKVLATHNIARGIKLLIVDILGEVLVLSQSQTGLRLITRLSDENAEMLRKPAVERVEPVQALGDLLSRLRNNPKEVMIAEEPDALPMAETLEELAASLEAPIEATPEPQPAARLIKTDPALSTAGGDSDPTDFDSFLGTASWPRQLEPRALLVATTRPAPR